jgi:hypothetical protein
MRGGQQSSSTIHKLANLPQEYGDLLGAGLGGSVMFLVMAAMLGAAAAPQKSVNVRGNGVLTCATAFQAENREGTANWIAGYWAAWDMSQVNVARALAPSSDLNGIVGEVEKVCRDEPSNTLLLATLKARNAVKARK